MLSCANACSPNANVTAASAAAILIFPAIIISPFVSRLPVSTLRRSTRTGNRSLLASKGYSFTGNIFRSLRRCPSVNSIPWERLQTMDDTYQINFAKTEFREGYNRGDVDRILSVFDEEGFTDMSEGGASSYGEASMEALGERLKKLFAKYTVTLAVIIIEIV